MFTISCFSGLAVRVRSRSMEMHTSVTGCWTIFEIDWGCFATPILGSCGFLRLLDPWSEQSSPAW